MLPSWLRRQPTIRKMNLAVLHLREKSLEQRRDQRQLTAQAVVAFDEVQDGLESFGITDAVLERDQFIVPAVDERDEVRVGDGFLDREIGEVKGRGEQEQPRGRSEADATAATYDPRLDPTKTSGRAVRASESSSLATRASASRPR